MDVIDRAMRLARELLECLEEADRRVDIAIRDIRETEVEDRRIAEEDRKSEERSAEALRELEGGRGRDRRFRDERLREERLRDEDRVLREEERIRERERMRRGRY